MKCKLCGDTIKEVVKWLNSSTPVCEDCYELLVKDDYFRLIPERDSEDEDSN